MISAPTGSGKANSLMAEYSTRLGEAVLRTRTREAERHARHEAEIARRVKSEFIANMSHELRTPLNTVIGFSKLLAEQDRRRLSDIEITEYARLIQDAAGHLLSLINDILDISKLQSGHYALDAQEIDIEGIVEATVSSLARHAAVAGLKISCTIREALPVTVGDQQKLQQALTNLITNAIKFTPSGGGISVEAFPEKDSGTHIVIRDSGVGMEQTEVDVALTPFGQVDAGRSRWREGAGLGLPIAKALIELHGGNISITSSKGVGTEVRVFIPSRLLLANMDRQELALGLSRYSQNFS
jgi:two-component system cell cycle sensor histidine kinase PleC